MYEIFFLKMNNMLVCLSIKCIGIIINIYGKWVKPVLNDIKLHLPDFEFSATKVHFANVVMILVLIASNFASHAHLCFQKSFGSVKNNVFDVMLVVN